MAVKYGTHKVFVFCKLVTLPLTGEDVVTDTDSLEFARLKVVFQLYPDDQYGGQRKVEQPLVTGVLW